jgi:hypothetical protein
MNVYIFKIYVLKSLSSKVKVLITWAFGQSRLMNGISILKEKTTGIASPFCYLRL